MLKIFMVILVITIPIVTTDTIYKEFNENEISATAKYKNKIINLTGIVNKITKVDDENAEVWLADCVSVTVPLEKNKKVLLALKKNDKISCVCIFNVKSIFVRFTGLIVKKEKK